jgi:hypothetical protein
MTEMRPSLISRTAALRALLPDQATLLEGLTSVLGGGGAARERVTIIEREPNCYASSHPSEIVTCRLGDGQELRALCKYEAAPSHPSYGHRANVAYEAAVYRHVLQPLKLSAPRSYGSYRVSETGDRWLILEYVDGGVRADRGASARDALRLAARWVGRFHALNAAHIARAPVSFLKVYDAAYYRQWAQRTLLLAGEPRRRYRWLAPLCERFVGSVDLLLAPPPTAIHGELTPKNTLIRGGAVYPVDWESAAVAAGEIDLAGLTDAWPPEIVRECELEYQRVRWPEGPPPEFAATLAIARLYWNFRWLGDRPQWTGDRKGEARFERLRSIAERSGLL